MSKYYLVADIGGTNSNFELVEKNVVNDVVNIINIKKEKFSTNGFKSLTKMISFFLKDIDFKVTEAIFSIAGAVGRELKLSNSKIEINRNDILRNTSLKNIRFFNDLEAIGYGVSTLKPEQIKIINEGKKYNNQPISIIAAGTGLGKSVLVYDEINKKYGLMASEGGHSDLVVMTKDEIELSDFIREKYNIDTIEFEDILSGRGIERIYHFITGNKKNANDISNLKSNGDEFAQKTFDIFYKFYSRCCKETALEHLSIGGIYLAGGIVDKNLDFSREDFMTEFMNNSGFRNMLKEIPIYIIIDYDVNIQGLKNLI